MLGITAVTFVTVHEQAVLIRNEYASDAIQNSRLGIRKDAVECCSDFVTLLMANQLVYPILEGQRVRELFRASCIRLITFVLGEFCRAGLNLFSTNTNAQGKRKRISAPVSNCHSWKDVTGSCG